ncbi:MULTISPECIES: hypothetical protein [unclassified Sporosarcina]|uniref:hypothetical protein n=1 Tax=unclassified Sporosarcina TaxID=2647733 RepID=UPI00203C7407|nr:MULTISPECIES: hypothetical protein [unclassified Sporosarcina]
MEGDYMNKWYITIPFASILLISGCGSTSSTDNDDSKLSVTETIEESSVKEQEEVRGRDKTATYITQEELEKRREERDRAYRLEHGTDNASSSKQAPTIGMTDYEVIETTWGKPTKINKTETINGIREQWIYSNGYLYFEDHYLVSISSSR